MTKVLHSRRPKGASPSSSLPTNVGDVQAHVVLDRILLDRRSEILTPPELNFLGSIVDYLGHNITKYLAFGTPVEGLEAVRNAESILIGKGTLGKHEAYFFSDRGGLGIEIHELSFTNDRIFADGVNGLICFNKRFTVKLLGKDGFHILPIEEVPVRTVLKGDVHTRKNLGETSLPRWAEEKRMKKPVKLRLDPQLTAAVDEAAKAEGLDRNNWITQAIQRSLKPL